MGLRCFTQAFSSCREWGLSFGVCASHFRQGSRRQGFGSCRPLALGRQAQWLRLAGGFSCSAACGIFPDQGSNPVSPALAGGFFTAETPRKLSFFFKLKYCWFTMLQVYSKLINLYTYIFQILLHYRLLQDNQYSSICYRVGPYISSLYMCVCDKSLSCVQFFATPWTVACQVPLPRAISQARIL